MMDDLPEPEPKTPHRGKKRSNTQCRSTGQSMGQKRGHVIGMVLSAADHPRSGTQTRSRTWPRPDPEMMTARYWGRALSSKSRILPSISCRTEILFLGPGGQSNQAR